MEKDTKTGQPKWEDGKLKITAISPINIALIKYWGKVNEEYIIPLNSSLSITLSTDDLCSTTSVYLSDQFENDTLTLNGESEEFTTRIQGMMKVIRDQVPEDGIEVEGKKVTKEELLKMHVSVVSDNNFPTASGVASSSSGLSCLALCLAKIYGCDMDMTEISKLARLGSGSACRSLFGGYVEWDRGFDNLEEVDSNLETIGKNSKAVLIQDEKHWPDLCCCICVADSSQKKVSSTKGMKTSVETSEFLKHREKVIVPKHLSMIKDALKDKDWNALSEIIMKESNSLHSVCLDTYPPIFYQNDTTKALISMVHDLNNNHYEPIAAYTVDAGANVFLITPEKNLKFLLNTVKDLAGLSDDKIKFSFEKDVESEHNQVDGDAMTKIENEYKSKINLHQIIVTRVGKGVTIIDK
jgi:diphosphomevalonate decarboxylase